MSQSPNEFVHWLISRMEDPLNAQCFAAEMLAEIYTQAQTVDTTESQRSLAIAEHEKFLSLMAAGFSRQEALSILIHDRQALLREAVIQTHEEQRRKNDGS